jgi:hypothetical protein
MHQVADNDGCCVCAVILVSDTDKLDGEAAVSIIICPEMVIGTFTEIGTGVGAAVVFGPTALADIGVSAGAVEAV